MSEKTDAIGDKSLLIIRGAWLGICCVGCVFALAGCTFTVSAQLLSALAGMIFVGKYA